MSTVGAEGRQASPPIWLTSMTATAHLAGRVSDNTTEHAELYTPARPVLADNFEDFVAAAHRRLWHKADMTVALRKVRY
jgi:hypothetical protein